MPSLCDCKRPCGQMRCRCCMVVRPLCDFERGERRCATCRDERDRAEFERECRMRELVAELGHLLRTSTNPHRLYLEAKAEIRKIGPNQPGMPSLRGWVLSPDTSRPAAPLDAPPLSPADAGERAPASFAGSDA